MVKELGIYLEEFAREYMLEVEGCEWAMVDYPFRIERENHKAVICKEKQAYHSDIDVLASKEGKTYIVSCQEWIGGKSDVQKINRNFKYGERFVERKFPNTAIVKKIVCVTKRKDLEFDVEVLYLKDMFNELLSKMRDKAIRSKGRRVGVVGAFEWIARDLDVAGFFDRRREEAYKVYKFPSPKTMATCRAEE